MYPLMDFISMPMLDVYLTIYSYRKFDIRTSFPYNPQ